MTHQLQYLQHADNIVTLQNGSVVYQGTYTQIRKERQRCSSILSQGKQETDINDILTALSEEETVTTVDPFDKLRERMDLEEEEEDRMVGTVKWRLYWKYFRAALPVVLIVGLAAFFVVVQGNNFVCYLDFLGKKKLKKCST